MRATFDRAGRVSVRTVLQDGAANFHATLSPDQRWLAYDSDRDGTRAVYVAEPDGRASRLVSGDGYAASPHWSPDGRKLAFIKADPRRPRVWNVWLLDLATGALTAESRHTIGQAWGPSWFPDSRRIAYSIEDQLVIRNIVTGGSRTFRSPLRGRLVRTPAVSPDGRRIVLQVHGDGVWMLDLRSGAFTRLLADHTAEEFAWTPDARNVVFHTRRRGAWSLWELGVGAS